MPLNQCPIYCDDPDCRLPAGRIVNGSLVFTARHYGRRHEVTLSLEYLRQLIEKDLTNEVQPMLCCPAMADNPSS